MDFIFMLTRDDRTVADALDVLELIRPLGLGHIGFKDVGVSPRVLEELAAAIRAMGAVTYMELVSTAPEACLRSARIGRELGVHRLLGGTQCEEVLSLLKGSGTQYFPFPGRPVGHPTRLEGGPEEVEADCRLFATQGCGGCDLLAYRATQADPLELIAAARRGIGPEGYLVVAGAVNSFERVQAVKRAGADAFTIGTAIFDGSYSRAGGSVVAQLRDVLADCRRASALTDG